jgi:hypothetical protein
MGKLAHVASVCRHWLVLAFLLIPLAVRAEVIFDVFIGHGLGVSDGVVTEGGWFPVTCEVQNNGPGFNAAIEIVGGQFGHGQVRRVNFELPSGTKKRFTVPVFCSRRYNMSVDARLLTEKGRVIAKQLGLKPWIHVDWQSPLLASLPKNHGGAALLPEIQNNKSQFTPAATRLGVDSFPENPIALEGISMLYLHSARALDLKQPQYSALVAWMHGGGHLVLGVEQPSDVNALPWLAGILPCTLGEVLTNDNHRAIHEWLTTFAEDEVTQTTGNRGKGTLVRSPFAPLKVDDEFESAPMPLVAAKVRDGEVLLGTRAEPLAVSAPRGRGKITVFLFSPELKPFSSWKNKHWFWAKLGGVPKSWLAGSQSPNSGYQPIDGVFGAMVDSKQIRKLPVGWLLLLLVAYLIVIGPLDQFWLKKINKQMLTWVTFPAYVVLFSALIYGIGYALRSGETEWNELQIVDVVPHGARADLRGRTFGSAYSPANARYPLVSDQPFATLRGEATTSGGGDNRDDRIEQRGNSFSAEVAVPVWTSQLYVNDWWRQENTPLRVTVTPAPNNQWNVQIDNPARKPVSKAKIIIKDRIHDIPGFNGDKTLTISRSSGQPVAQFVQNEANRFNAAVAQRNRQFGNEQFGRLDDILTSATAASFLAMTAPVDDQAPNYGYHYRFVSPRGFDLSADARRGDAVLIAYAPGHGTVAALNKFSPRRSKRDSVYRVIGEVKGL